MLNEWLVRSRRLARGDYFLIVLIVGLVVFGPKRLPEMTKQLGQGIRDFQKGLDGVKANFKHASVDDLVAFDESAILGFAGSSTREPGSRWMGNLHRLPANLALTDAQKIAILGGNAAKMLGMKG